MSTEGPPALVPVEVHLADALAAIRPIQPVTVPLETAEGGVLAEDVTASTALPPFDNSAMDGYAVQAEDLPRRAGDTRSGCRCAARSRPATPGLIRWTRAPACAS